MSKLRDNLIASLEGAGSVRKIALFYQSKAALARRIACILPYPSIIVDSTKRRLTDEEAATISHVIELYEPFGLHYDLCRVQHAAVRAKGYPILSLYDWTEQYLDDSFWGNTDYYAQARQLDAIMLDIAKVNTFHITSALGTDISFSVAGRRWIVANGLCRNDELSQLPDGEIYTCPVEESFTGIIVVDERSAAPGCHHSQSDWNLNKESSCIALLYLATILSALAYQFIQLVNSPWALISIIEQLLVIFRLMKKRPVLSILP